MKVYNSSIFGKLQEPESFDELIKILTTEEVKNYIPVRYWRGQSNIDWPIDSSGYRRVKFETVALAETMLISYEKQLIENATHKGYRYQNGRELYDFELLGRLRHHGAATRLVDFSKNAFIALHFCINSDLNRTGLLFGLHTSYIIGDEGTTRKETYDEIIKDCDDDSTMTWEPTSISNRVAAQHSQFLYSKVSLEKTGSLILPKEEKAKMFIAISPKMKRKLKWILEGLFDFRSITLFPDIDGFGLANSEQINRYEMDRW